MKIEKYPYGWIVDRRKIITPKIIVENNREDEVPIVNDIKEYLKTGRMTSTLRELTTIYGQVHMKIDTTVSIFPTNYTPKKKAINRAFLLTGATKNGVYVYTLEDNPKYKLIGNTIIIDLDKYTVTYFHPKIPRNTPLGKKIEKALFNTEKLSKIIEKSFPALGDGMKIMVKRNSVHAVIHRPLPLEDIIIVEKDGKFDVSYGNKAVGWYIYGCGRRITKYGFDAEKVPCYRDY